MTGLTLGYGYQPWRALLALLAITAVAVALAISLGSHGALARPGTAAVSCTATEQVGIGLDLGLPPGEDRSPGSLQHDLWHDRPSPEAAGWTLQVLAWTFATLFVAGLTGAVRKTKPPPARHGALPRAMRCGRAFPRGGLSGCRIDGNDRFERRGGPAPAAEGGDPMERDRALLTALRDESGALSAVLRRADPGDFGRPTNCPPWNLNELVVHIAMSIHVGDDDELPAATPHSGVMAAGYYRRPERDTSDYRQSNVDRTRKAASDVLARMSAARWFDEVSQDTVMRLSRLYLGRFVQIPSCGPMKGRHPGDVGRRTRPRCRPDARPGAVDRTARPGGRVPC